MKNFKEGIGIFLVVIILILVLVLNARYFINTKTENKTETIRQELINELDTNKKIVVFEFKKFTDSIEEEQETLDLLINDGLDRGYIISTIEIVEGNGITDRTILIFENGY